MTSASAKETFLRHNSLACYLELVIGQEITVELRDESSISGRLDHVDGFMNVRIIDAVLVTSKGAKKRFESVQVAGRQIRFVQLPPDVKPSDALRSYIQSSQAARVKAQVESVQSSRSSRLLTETRLLRDEIKQKNVKPGPGGEK